MYRDFSDASKENLLKLVSEVDEENWCGVTDWFGDRWLDFQGWIGHLKINKCLNDIDRYHKKIVDKNNTTKNAIEEIFCKVASIDRTYDGIFGNLSSLLSQWNLYIEQLSEITNPYNGSFNTIYLKKHTVCDCCGKNFSRKSHYKNRERWLCLGGCKATKEYLDDAVLFSKINAVIKEVKRNPCLLFLEPSEEAGEECTLTREYLRKERDVRNLMNDMNSSLQSIKKLLFDLQTEKFSKLAPVLSKEYTDELIMHITEFPIKKEGLDIEFLRETVSKIIVQSDGNIRIRFINGKVIGNSQEVSE